MICCIRLVTFSIVIDPDYNPRKWDDMAIANLKESIRKFGMVDPIIVNGAENRKNIVIGGHFRLAVAKQSLRNIPGSKVRGKEVPM